MSQFDLQDKVAIVTGAGRGTGAVIALECAEAGANVVVVSRTQVELDKVAADIKALGRECLAVATDICVPEQVDNMVKQTVDKFGRIDVLINNAGGILFMKTMKDLSLEEWNGTVALNMTAVFLCSQAVGKVMIEQKAGKIVNISSVASTQGYPVSPHYGAAKAGLNNLTQSLADGWAKHNINVNGIAPGLIATEAMKSYGVLPPETNPDGTPVPGALLPSSPEKIAHLAIYLSSEAADRITGQTIVMGAKAQMRSP